jgi:predicted urease superfamily metal-dependent hydrolase
MCNVPKTTQADADGEDGGPHVQLPKRVTNVMFQLLVRRAECPKKAINDQ